MDYAAIWLSADLSRYWNIYTKASIIERLYYSTMNGEMEQWEKKTERSGEEKPKYI